MPRVFCCCCYCSCFLVSIWVITKQQTIKKGREREIRVGIVEAANFYNAKIKKQIKKHTHINLNNMPIELKKYFSPPSIFFILAHLKKITEREICLFM